MRNLPRASLISRAVSAPIHNPVFHLELHTPDRAGASQLYRELWGWRQQHVRVRSACYLALELAPGIGGGIVECAAPHALWLPYVKVSDVELATERARGCGARVLLEPREGRAGRRSVIATPAGGEIALWQAR
jgi:predicted enzyme related to lactoylglutathione lyase